MARDKLVEERLAELEEDIQRLRGYISTLNFVFSVSIVQQGPSAVDLFLSNTKSLKPNAGLPPEMNIVVKQAMEAMEGIREQITDLNKHSMLKEDFVEA